METLRFLTPEDVRAVAETHGTPTYVYDRATLDAQAARARAFPNAYGLTVRYAMKASPNAAILKTFKKAWPARRRVERVRVRASDAAGFAGGEISLSTQELPTFFEDLVRRGVKVNACSLDQLERFGGRSREGRSACGSTRGWAAAGRGRRTWGGRARRSGFGSSRLPRVKEIVEKYDLKVVRVHTHIGSGSDPAVWQKVSGMSLDLCREFPSVDTLNLGGGYKVGRMSYEKSTDLAVVGVPVKEAFEAFAKETGRQVESSKSSPVRFCWPTRAPSSPPCKTRSSPAPPKGTRS